MSDQPQCKHKWVFLRDAGEREKGYSRWVHVDVFFCEKCLAQREIETEIKRKKEE